MKMNLQEAMTAWQTDAAHFEACGAVLPDVVAYVPDDYKRNYTLAMDAQPLLSTTANSGIPAFLTTLIDPAVFKILFAPNKAAQILSETRKGTWLDETAMFPTVEYTGEVSSYGDFAENGHTGVNTNWPQRQSYLFQTVKEYGERELERAGLGRINWVSELDQAAATVMNKFSNLTYFFGVQGLQNYGLLNDPNLPASLTPATKAAGGVAWIAGGLIKATANEVYADIQALFYQLVQQTGGLVEADSKMVLAMSPGSQVALTATNTYNVNVEDLLKKNFPNLRIETAVQYGVLSAQNPQGVAGGNLIQLIAEELEGQNTGYCSFNEKMRAHPIIRGMSSFKQKVTGGSWGAIIRMPVAFASMLGV
jgi:hypothetical protein